VGTPNEVFCHPANKFVAGFIGSPQMNFFNAKLMPKDGGYAVELLGIKIVLPQSKAEALRRGGNVPENVIIGVRPEHIDVLPENSEGVINAEVEVSEMMGSEIYLHVDLDGHDTVIRVPVLDLPNSGREMPGRLSEISFRFRPDQIHIFDAQTQYNVIGIDRNKKGMA
jgi:multiple sugar transport system ATP-binding protein